MALGDTYNNNRGDGNRNKISVHSKYRMNNADSSIDPSCLTFRFWASHIVICIHPLKYKNENGVSFDMDGGIEIYLTASKARILKHEIELFMENPDTYVNQGVSSGMGIIYISNGAQYDAAPGSAVLTILKLNTNGGIESEFAYEFHRNYHFSTRNFKSDDSSFDKYYDDYQNVEIEQLYTILDEFIKAATSATAFSVVDASYYNINRIDNKLNNIAQALGVQNNYYKKTDYTQSYFNKDNNSNDGGNSYKSNNKSYGSSSTYDPYATATLDDID